MTFRVFLFTLCFFAFWTRFISLLTNFVHTHKFCKQRTLLWFCFLLCTRAPTPRRWANLMVTMFWLLCTFLASSLFLACFIYLVSWLCSYLISTFRCLCIESYLFTILGMKINFHIIDLCRFFMASCFPSALICSEQEVLSELSVCVCGYVCVWLISCGRVLVQIACMFTRTCPLFFFGCFTFDPLQPHLFLLWF